MILVKALGLGMALAVALDATLVRGLLVPATMRLLGNLNWWLPFVGVQRRPSLLAESYATGESGNGSGGGQPVTPVKNTGVGGKR